MKDNSRNNRGWRKVVRNFSPSWFTVNMGTGIVSILLFQLPYNGQWLYWLSVTVFCLNVVLFVLASAISLIRYTLWPEIWIVMVRHPNQSLFLGAIPMGLSTIINMMIFICSPIWGDWVTYTAWGLWMFDAVLSIAIAFYMPFLATKQKGDTELSAFTALQLFPSVAPVVASVSAGIVASALTHQPERALATIITGYVLWGIGFPMALFLMVIYFQRLVVHKLPPKELIVSVFLPVGPPSLGAYSVLELGIVAMQVFPDTKTIHPLAGVILYNLGVITALVFWGFAILWFFFAVATIAHCKKFPFNMGWWGFTFPIGCLAISSNKLGIVLPSRFFRVVGTIISTSVFILWLVVSIGTIRGALSSKLFNTPDLKDLKDDEDDAQKQDTSLSKVA